jgi:type III secretion system (T3SS) inner membrane Yop/YscD-like protein
MLTASMRTVQAHSVQAHSVQAHSVGKDEPLGPRATLLGRSRACDIVIHDARLSPRHARFFNSWRGMTVQDVSGTDGMRVNQQRFTGAREIQVGDWLSLGPLEVQVRKLPEPDGPLGRAPPRAVRSAGALSENPVRGPAANTFAILASVAAKFFLLRQGQEAERILRPPLEDLLARCEGGVYPATQDAELAAKLAVRLADQTRDARWIDYVFRVWGALRRPLPASIGEQLHVLVRQLPGTSLAGFRAYTSVLRAAYPQLSPAEQFLVRRVEGLEALLSR